MQVARTRRSASRGVTAVPVASDNRFCRARLAQLASIRAPAAFLPALLLLHPRLISYARRSPRYACIVERRVRLCRRRSCSEGVVMFTLFAGAWPALLSAWRCRSRWWRRRLRRLSLRCRRAGPVSCSRSAARSAGTDLRAGATGRDAQAGKGATVLVEGTADWRRPTTMAVSRSRPCRRAHHLS